METARSDSAIPSRAQALFPEAEFKLRHPIFQAMPYPLGADPRLLELENFVLKSLDPETGETLRHASIRYVGRWLSIREISRHTGLARNTVKKYLRAGDEEPRYARRASPSKLDPYADKLSTWLSIEATKSRKQRRTLLQLHTPQV